MCRAPCQLTTPISLPCPALFHFKQTAGGEGGLGAGGRGDCGAEIIAGASRELSEGLQAEIRADPPSASYFYNLKRSAIIEVIMSAFSPALPAARFQIVSIGKGFGAGGVSS